LLPNGRKLVTLKDAGAYTKLPKAEHDAPEWQAAMEALILIAEHGGPTMLARIGVMRALNRHVEQLFNSSRKEPHWGKRKLKRDEQIAAQVMDLANSQIFRRRLPLVWDFVIADLVAFPQVTQARLLDRGNMDENVLAAAVRLNKAVTLCRIEPLHCTHRHVKFSISLKTRWQIDTMQPKEKAADVNRWPSILGPDRVSGVCRS
jgi:hypothetical protein